MRDLVLLLVALVYAGAQPPAVTGAPEAEAGPAPVVESEPLPEASGARRRELLVVGDSLAVGARPHLEAALPGWEIETSAFTGRHASDGVAEITSRPELPPVVVAALGTNDDPSAVESFEAGVEAVLAAAGPGTCVVWPNIVRPPYNGVSYSGYNRALARSYARHPNLIVVDWAGIADASPGLLAPDGVHATPEGYAARGQAIAQAVMGCGGGIG